MGDDRTHGDCSAINDDEPLPMPRPVENAPVAVTPRPSRYRTDRHLRWELPRALRAVRRRDIMWKDALVLSLALQDLRIFRVGVPNEELFRQHRARPRGKLGRWIFDWLRKRQRPDPAHHAPGCRANRWAGMELVIQPCTCGAWRIDGIDDQMNTEG